MPLCFRTLAASLLCLFSTHIAFSQTTTDSVADGDTTYIFKDDTLFTNKGFSIYPGQHLIAGKGSDDDRHYRSIGFKSAFAFPLLFLRGEEIKNNMDYQQDPNLRDRDKVRDYLDSGTSLIVKKIRSRGRKKKWHYYELFLADGKSSLSLHYRCDIITALRRKEIRLQ